LQALLRAPLQVTAVNSQVFPEKWVTADEVIVTHRFLIIREGVMDYTVEGVARRLEAGVQFFVPAWCRREWTVPRRTGVCRLVWCEFSSGAVDVPSGLCWRVLPAGKEEIAAFERMRALSVERDGRAAALQREGELKACLARFWPEARTGQTAGERTQAVHPEVARARVWLERHFAEADALECFYRTVALSPNHFRMLFKRQTGETVQAVLARLRLRRARYLVQETAMPMKRIAAETGFVDPLYFSGQYKKFWGRAATEDRRSVGVA
jgi:AraC-like DNA-binding protein